MSAEFPALVVTYAQAQFHRVNNLGLSTLNGAIGASPATIVVASISTVTTWPVNNFCIRIDNEVYFISSRAGTTLTVGASGFGGTSAAAHADGSEVRVVADADFITKVSDEVIAIESFFTVPGGTINWAAGGASNRLHSNFQVKTTFIVAGVSGVPSYTVGLQGADDAYVVLSPGTGFTGQAGNWALGKNGLTAIGKTNQSSAQVANAWLRVKGDSGGGGPAKQLRLSVDENNHLDFQIEAASTKIYFNDTGTDIKLFHFTNSRNIGLMTDAGSYGNGAGVVFVADRTTAPAADPSGGYVFYSQSGGARIRAGAFTAVILDANGNTVVGGGTLATTATNGYLLIPNVAGTPTGVPAATGGSPVVYDTTNNKFYVYNGGWKSVTLA